MEGKKGKHKNIRAAAETFYWATLPALSRSRLAEGKLGFLPLALELLPYRKDYL